MLLARCIAVFVFGIAALASFLLSYAALLDKSDEMPASPIFRWTDAVSRCGQEAPACRPQAIIEQTGSAPLSPRPFAIALGQPGARTSDLAERLYRRAPRSQLARVTLAERALRAGDQQAFLSHFMPLLAIDRQNSSSYVEVLSTLSLDPAFRGKIKTLLEAERPHWGGAYLARLGDTAQLPLSELINLSRNYPSAQRRLLNKLQRANQWDIALLAFMDFSENGFGEPDAERLDFTVPYNPELLDHVAPPPFNWSLRSKGAEFLHSGGVYAFYQGRRNETFLSQTFSFSPGQHTLAIVQSGQANEASGFFRWSLACASDRKQIASTDVKALKVSPQTLKFEFEILPGSCAFQTLSLHGVAGTFPQPARIEVSSVRLLAATAEQEAP